MGSEIVKLAIVIPDGVDKLQPRVSQRVPAAGIPPGQAITYPIPTHERVKQIIEGFPIGLEITNGPALLNTGSLSAVFGSANAR